jgi:hypothetical protein
MTAAYADITHKDKPRQQLCGNRLARKMGIFPTEGNEGSEGLPRSGRIGIYLCFLRYLLLKKVPADRPAVAPYLSVLSGQSVVKLTSVPGEKVVRIYGRLSLQSS